MAARLRMGTAGMAGNPRCGRPGPTAEAVEFPFPFPAYTIQKQLMQEVYNTIEAGAVGIFESPTGTGKTLSLICSTLLWHRRHREQYLRGDFIGSDVASAVAAEAAVTSSNSSSRQAGSPGPSWLANFGQTRARKQIERTVARAQEQEAALAKRLARIRRGAAAGTSATHSRRRPNIKWKNGRVQEATTSPAGAELHVGEDGDEFLVEAESGSDSLLDSDHDSVAREEDAVVYLPKVIFASRTHSQLGQFVKEAKKTVFGSDLRVVSLGSRKALCINKDVRKLGSVAGMNEACLQLKDRTRRKRIPQSQSNSKTKRGRGTTGGCPFLPPLHDAHFGDQALAQPLDVEELAQLGSDLGVCPYYGSRAAIAEAEVITMPYSMLLNKHTRESIGLKLSKCVVVVDEGHNLVDAINSSHSASLGERQASNAHRALTAYVEKYRSRLLGKNRFFCEQLLLVLTKLLAFMDAKKLSKEQRAVGGRVVRLATLLHEARLTTDLFQLARYLERSQLSRKLKGFLTHLVPEVTIHKRDTSDSEECKTSAAQAAEVQRPSTTAMQSVEAFITALNAAHTDDARVTIRVSEQGETRLKCIMLDPAIHFREVVDAARSVIVAGGTMQPVSHVVDMLFSHLDASSVRVFSCGHVIPQKNLLAVSLPEGPSGHRFNFSFKHRRSHKQLDELGQLLCNICQITPGGVVCFVASYSFAAFVRDYFTASGVTERLQKRKKVLYEPRASKDLDALWRQFASAVESGSGAILFCVVGGKMSEGINFSDDLARCVVVVGLPYPNSKDPELAERMQYLTARQHASTTAPKESIAKPAGSVYYENLCMKAVNQSIGRAIRHKGDFATIVLVDERYAQARISDKIPGWIQERLKHPASFRAAFPMLASFFRSHRQMQADGKSE